MLKKQKVMKFLNPNKVLQQLDLQEEIVIADFGCGSGGWVIPLAKELEKAKIYAIDVLEEPLSVLKSEIQNQKISNITIILADVEDEKGLNIADKICDLVLMTNLLFQCEDKKAVLKEGKRVLKKNGKILIVDWKDNISFGPKQDKVSIDELKKIAQEIDLRLKKEISAGEYHYGLVFGQ